jgi:hypothetical protein
MNLTSVDILHGLYIAVGIMLIVVLYHVIFIVVDLRKTMRRVASVSEEVEAAFDGGSGDAVCERIP